MALLAVMLVGYSVSIVSSSRRSEFSKIDPRNWTLHGPFHWTTSSGTTMTPPSSSFSPRDRLHQRPSSSRRKFEIIREAVDLHITPRANLRHHAETHYRLQHAPTIMNWNLVSLWPQRQGRTDKAAFCGIGSGLEWGAMACPDRSNMQPESCR